MKKERFVAGFFSSLMDKNIRFKLNPNSNPKPFSSGNIEVIEENFVDLHSDIAQKVDALITVNERVEFTEKLEHFPEEKVDLDP